MAMSFVRDGYAVLADPGVPDTISRQVRRARERREAAPARLFVQSPLGNRATRRARASRARRVSWRRAIAVIGKFAAAALG